LLRRACEVEALRGGLGGGRRAVAAVALAFAAPGFGLPLAWRFAWRLGSERRASRMMNQPIATITSTPAPKRPKVASTLGFESLDDVVFVREGVGVV
jgi:hypothetical protein